MRILLVYGTNTGGTYEAATIIRDILRSRKHSVVVRNAKDVLPGHLRRFDAVILGSCTWERMEKGQRIEGELQQDVRALAQRLRKGLFPDKAFALFVLGDKNFTFFCKAAQHLQELVQKMQGRIVGSVLRIDRYNYRLAKNRERVAMWANTLAGKLTKGVVHAEHPRAHR